MSSEPIMQPEARDSFIVLGFVACVLLLGLVWFQTQSVAVLINVFGGMMAALTVGRWLEQRAQEQEERQTSTEVGEVSET